MITLKERDRALGLPPLEDEVTRVIFSLSLGFLPWKGDENGLFGHKNGYIPPVGVLQYRSFNRKDWSFEVGHQIIDENCRWSFENPHLFYNICFIKILFIVHLGIVNTLSEIISTWIKLKVLGFVNYYYRLKIFIYLFNFRVLHLSILQPN